MPRPHAIAGFLIAAGMAVPTIHAQSAQDTPPDATAPSAPGKAAKKPAKPSSAPVPEAPVPDAPTPNAPVPDAAVPAAPAPDSAPPGDTGSAADPAPATNPATNPATAQAPAKKRSAAEENPFPEEYSKEAEKAAKAAEAPAATHPDESPPADNSTAEKSTGSSSQAGLDKVDLYGDKDKKSKHADPDAGMAYDPRLAAEDDKIAGLYLKNGNAAGAYGRFKDAAQHDAGDANAVFGLAQAAQQMHLTDEAIENYQTYLFAFPDGPKSEAAKKALATLRLQAKK